MSTKKTEQTTRTEVEKKTTKDNDGAVLKDLNEPAETETSKRSD